MALQDKNTSGGGGGKHSTPINKNARDFFDYRFQQFRNEKSSWITHEKNLVKNYMPRRGKFDSNDRNKGTKQNQLNNNTPLFAKRTLRAGLMSGVTSPARPWFKTAAPDYDLARNDQMRAWYEILDTTVYRVFEKAGLYRVLPNIYEELGVIGTAAMIQDEDFENITSFMPFTVGEYYLDINGKLKVDTFGREYQRTVYQVIDEFGWENVTNHVRSLYNSSNYSSYIDLKHIIEPNIRQLDSFEMPDPSIFKWRSVVYETSARNEGDGYLAIKGYRDFPVHAPRWDTKPGDTYGNSPGMDGLGDSNALQVQEREVGKAIAKMVTPPTIAPTSLKNIQVSLLPGANNFSDDPNNTFRAIYQVDPRVQELEMKIKSTEERINRAFYVDLFLMLANDNRLQRATATEVAQKHEEKLLQLGPVLENLNNELLDPLIKRTVSMLVRASEPGWKGFTDFMVLPPPPKEVQEFITNGEMKVEYISVLAQAQKMVTTGATERWVGFVGNMGAIPGLEYVVDKVNGDEIAEKMADDLGVPNKSVNSDDKVEGIREGKQKQADQANMQQAVASGADAAKTLSETDTTGGNVLTDVLGVGG
jgi:hypothetical protein